MRRSNVWLLTLVACLTLVIAACGGADDPESAGDAPAGEAATDDAPADDAATDDGDAADPATDDAAAAEDVTITFVNWASAEEATRPNIDQVIADFEEANPNITIDSVPIPFGDIPSQITTMAQAGNAPDVAQTAVGYTATFAGLGILEPLDSYDEELVGQLAEPLVDLGRDADGALVALPWQAAPFGFWYNRDLMEQAGLDPESPPETLDEFTEAMMQVRSELTDVVPFGLDTSIRDFGLDHNWAPMLAFGAEPIMADGTFAANTPQMREYVEWVGLLMDEGLTQPARRLGEFRPLAAGDQLAFAFDGPYFKGTLQSIDTELTDEAFYDKWGVTGFPAGEDGEHYTVPTDHQLVMFADSENKDAAWLFMSHLAANEEALRTYILPTGSLPGRADAVELFPEELDNPVIASFQSDVLPGLVRPPYGPQYPSQATIIMTELQRVFAEGGAPEDIVESMQQNLESAQ
ncbi:extracellular solute-binding protein [soil metagenome]